MTLHSFDAMHSSTSFRNMGVDRRGSVHGLGDGVELGPRRIKAFGRDVPGRYESRRER
jgi:hypothetical protein